MKNSNSYLEKTIILSLGWRCKLFLLPSFQGYNTIFKLGRRSFFKLMLSALIFLIFAICVNANEITFLTNQSEYYFLIGQDAIIPLKIENDFNEDISGILTYTITQEINQNGFSYSNTNSQAKTFVVKKDEDTINIGLGKSNQPSTLKVSLVFKYTKKETYIVSLNDLIIHFIDDNSQKQQNSEKKQSSQEEQEESQQSSKESQNEQEQQSMTQEQIQQKKVQNNQINQDSNALKKQLQNEIAENEQMQNQFEQNIEQKKQLQTNKENLENQGYELTDKNLNPISNNTGDFEYEYQDKNGNKASMKGSMKNGTLENFDIKKSINKQQILDKLKNNENFQEFQQQLENESYLKIEENINTKKNQTFVEVNYKNQLNKTAKITAEFKNDTIEKVKLKKENNNNKFFLGILLLVIVLASLYFLRKYFKKNDINIDDIKKIKKPFDYKKYAKKLLANAEKNFVNKEYKDAYGNAGCAIRTFLSYDNGLNKEITNAELLNSIKLSKDLKNIEYCLDICTKVEFAKANPVKKDFDKIINIAKKIIKS